jgi:rubrerythrin
MMRELTAFEILEVAETMEREAARFYRKAAGMYHDPRLCKLFADLAQWEKCHAQVFAEMKARFAQRVRQGGRFDLDCAEGGRGDIPVVPQKGDKRGMSLFPLPAVLHEKSGSAKELTGGETRADVLTLAIQKERGAIAYYTALTEFALGPDNTRIIQDILDEERKHVRILKQSLQQARDC